MDYKDIVLSQWLVFMFSNGHLLKNQSCNWSEKIKFILLDTEPLRVIVYIYIYCLYMDMRVMRGGKKAFHSHVVHRSAAAVE